MGRKLYNFFRTISVFRVQNDKNDCDQLHEIQKKIILIQILYLRKRDNIF